MPFLVGRIPINLFLETVFDKITVDTVEQDPNGDIVGCELIDSSEYHDIHPTTFMEKISENKTITKIHFWLKESVRPVRSSHYDADDRKISCGRFIFQGKDIGINYIDYIFTNYYFDRAPHDVCKTPLELVCWWDENEQDAEDPIIGFICPSVENTAQFTDIQMVMDGVLHLHESYCLPDVWNEAIHIVL